MSNDAKIAALKTAAEEEATSSRRERIHKLAQENKPITFAEVAEKQDFQLVIYINIQRLRNVLRY